MKGTTSDTNNTGLKISVGEVNQHGELAQLVDGSTLLALIFPKKRRPSLRWLQRRVKAKVIPSIKCGHYRFFIPEQVMAALRNKSVGLVPTSSSQWRNN